MRRDLDPSEFGSEEFFDYEFAKPLDPYRNQDPDMNQQADLPRPVRRHLKRHNLLPEIITIIVVTLLIVGLATRADAAVPEQATDRMAEDLGDYQQALYDQRIEELVELNGPYEKLREESASHVHTSPRPVVTTPDVEQWRELVTVYFGANTNRALSVMNCESGGNPNAKNKMSTASGLFQFLKAWWSGQWGLPAFDPFDPEANIAAAASLTNGGVDWGHWFASRHCHGLH